MFAAGNYITQRKIVALSVGKRMTSVLGVETNRKLDLWGASLKRKLV